MNSLPRCPHVRTVLTVVVALLSLAASRVTAVAQTLPPGASLQPFAFASARAALPSFATNKERHFDSDVFLTSKGKVALVMPWAFNGSNAWVLGLVGIEAALVLHQENVQKREVARIDEQIGMVALTDPTRAKVYRTEMERAMAGRSTNVMPMRESFRGTVRR